MKNNVINTYFGFITNPFSKTVKSEDLFKWKDFENLAARLNFFLAEGGIFLLTGGIGSGKTTSLRDLMLSLNPNQYYVIYIHDSLDSKKDFYSSILDSCGVADAHLASDSRRILRKHLEELTMVKKQVPLIILDEAQNLPAFILEEVRLIQNSNFDNFPLVNFILSGHKLLQQRISLHENEALRQRVTMKFHMNGFSLEETCSYISHRLEKAGSSSQIISDSILSRIHEESGGIPRVINNICRALLYAAYISEKKYIDDVIFDSARNEW